MHWSIGDMVLDLVQNSVEAGASVVEFVIDERDVVLDIMIRDNGRGMDEAVRVAALDPFYTEPGKHPGRRVGLGIPFLLQTVEQTGGGYQLESEPGHGTVLQFQLNMAHVDTPPLGELPDLLVDLMCFEADYDLRVDRRWNAGEPPDPRRMFRVSRRELCDVLGDITDVGSRRLARELLSDWESAIRGND